MLVKTLTALSFAFLFFCMPVSAKAEALDTIGTILEVEGTAKIRTGGGEIAASVNAPVHTGDVLLTGPASKIYVLLLDSTELTLSENGEFTIDDYLYDNENTAQNHAVYNAAKGAFLYVSGLLAKKENPDVTVKIPAGSIGIRGTRFWGGMIDGKYGVLVGDGAVDVDTGGGTVRVNKGEGTTLKGKGFMPDIVKKWPREKMDRAVKTVTLARPEKVGERIAIEKQEHQPFLRAQHKAIQAQKLDAIRKELEQQNPTLKNSISTDDLYKKLRAKNLESSTGITGTTSQTNRLQPFKKMQPVLETEKTTSTLAKKAAAAKAAAATATTTTTATVKAVTSPVAPSTPSTPATPTVEAVKARTQSATEKTTGAVTNAIKSRQLSTKATNSAE